MNLANDYKRRGWTLALIPANDKGPRERDWDKRDASVSEVERHLAAGGNLGQSAAQHLAGVHRRSAVQVSGGRGSRR